MPNETLLTFTDGHFVWLGDINTKDTPKSAGFRWNKIVEMRWATDDPFAAAALLDFADDAAKAAITPETRERYTEKRFLSHDGTYFVWSGPFSTNHHVRAAGFIWNGLLKDKWATDDQAKAAVLRDYSDDAALEAMKDATVALEESRAMDFDDSIEIPVPDCIDERTGQPMAYRPYQKAGIAFAYKYERTINGDEMGTGKTIMGAGLVNLIEKMEGRVIQTLVICPASLRLNWEKEMTKWLVSEHTMYVVNGQKDAPPAAANVVMVNYDVVHHKAVNEALMARQWDLILSDEAHYLKNNTTKRTKAVYGVEANKKKKIVAKDGLVHRTKYMQTLTGTPIPNRTREIFPALNALRPGLFGSFFTFGKKYCDAQHNGYGWDFNGSSNKAELQVRLRAGIMIRRLKKDVLAELPKKIRQVVELPLNGASALVKREAKAFEAHEARLEVIQSEMDSYWAIGDIENYRDSVASMNGEMKVAFSEMSEVRHELAMAKAPKVIEHTLNALESIGKVVVFAWHRDVIASIMDAMEEAGIKAVSITGDTKMTDRQAAVDAFQEDPETRVLVGNMQAAGTGWTMTASNHVIFAELDWVPANMTQAEDRCHRIGSEIHDCINIIHLVFDNSLDARMAKVLVWKQDVADATLDNETKIVIDLEEPVMPEVSKRDRRPAKFAVATSEERAAALEAVQYMTSLDSDHALELNSSGWSGIDSKVGHDLAKCASFTDGQVWLAKKILRKYRNTQLPTDVVETLFPETVDA